MRAAAEIAIAEPTHVSEARRVSVRLAQQVDFDETGQGRVAVVVTEIATNLLKHARSGRVVVSPVCHEHSPALDIYGFDAGPGITNLTACLRDGYSTAGSPGTGLGAISRMSEEWDVFTAAEQGTVIRARCRPKTAPRTTAAPLEVGGIVLPLHGDPDCGDAWSVRCSSAESLSMLMVDGLGHGYGAALAANAAVEIFLRHPQLSGVPLMEELHAGLRTTRGAAIATVEARRSAGTLLFTGAGNISGVIHDGATTQHLVSMNGIVGHRIGKLREFSYRWTEGSVLVLHSDGLRSRWNLNSYPGLQSRSPALIAGVLMRDSRRGTDDSSVAVAVQRGSRVS